MNNLFILLLYNAFFITVLTVKFTPVLELDQGYLRGTETTRGDLRKYLDIPYAQYNGRFQEPGPPQNWRGILDATKNRIQCVQYYENFGLPVGKENCLTLNIYTPGQSSQKKLLPVLFFIHGGGFFEHLNSEQHYNPEYLTKKNVIVVIPNYRLGAFGFLCLRIKGAPGNVGLKDQLAALQWTKDNIRAFGGNPQSITVLGHSAGAASAGYIVLAKEAKGLFQRAIMQSGTVLSPFSFAYDPIDRASLIASNLGYDTKNPYELLKIFTNATASEIVMATVASRNMNPLSTFMFRPCIEKKIVGTNPMILKNPRTLLEAGDYNKVPILLGFTNQEGLTFLGMRMDRIYAEIEDGFDYLPDNVVTDKDSDALTRQVRRYYFGSGSIKRNRQNLTDYLSDTFINYPSVAFSDDITGNGGTVYNYYFKYDSKRNYFKTTLGTSDQMGAAHGDDLFYLFQGTTTYVLPKNDKDDNIIEKMATMWTNFAKTGDPTAIRSSILPIKWMPSTSETQRYLTIDSILKMDTLPNANRMEFWRSIFNKYNLM